MHKNIQLKYQKKEKPEVTSNQEKVKPLLEVLKATRFAGAMFALKSLAKNLKPRLLRQFSLFCKGKDLELS